MGSEMCIRDSSCEDDGNLADVVIDDFDQFDIDVVTCIWSCNWLDIDMTGCDLDVDLPVGDDYSCEFEVCDSYDECSDTLFEFTVNPEENIVPVADAGPDQQVTISHDGDPEAISYLVSLDGSGSDENGN